MANIITISGQFGDGHTDFIDSPVIIKVTGLVWGNPNSSFKIVRIEVLDEDGNIVGNFRAETGGQTSITFDISSALKVIWAGYDYSSEVAAATNAVGGTASSYTRLMKGYSLAVYTEYLDSTDGELTITSSGVFNGGQCVIGGSTDMERTIGTVGGDVSSLEHTNVRNGDASTKPITLPERVGSGSITSWVDVNSSSTKSIFYPSDTTPDNDDIPSSVTGWTGHAPIVMRDSIAYYDFLFVNRRGAIETASAQMLESMKIDVSTEKYSHSGLPSFVPTPSLIARATGGRRSWVMSSGHQTREWAEWWALEFLRARRWWMLYNGRFLEVTVEPENSSTGIYDRTKQEMPSVNFTVTLALEG